LIGGIPGKRRRFWVKVLDESSLGFGGEIQDLDESDGSSFEAHAQFISTTPLLYPPDYAKPTKLLKHNSKRTQNCAKLSEFPIISSRERASIPSERHAKEIQADKEADKVNSKKYALVRTPSPEKSDSPDESEKNEKVDKKKKKRNRDA
jgi:hypothetical protein